MRWKGLRKATPPSTALAVELTDEELMSAYLGGDHDAFRALWERYSSKLERAIRRRIGDAEAARDLTQQAFLRFHRARNDFREGAKVRPWLYTIAFNLARDWGRKHGRRVIVEWDERDHPVQPTDWVVRQEDIDRMREALDQLDEKKREVIDLHWFEGLSFREISEITGDSLSAVKVRAHRTYKRLRAMLEDS